MSTLDSVIPYTSVGRVNADGVTVFYREAGPADAPVRVIAAWLSDIFVSISGIDSKPG